MSEKISLQDLSVLLAEKASITKKEAETFLREYFEVLNEELINDRLLKIKDLGTFKILWVEDRESIDVTTGERALIPAHYKVSFTPDKKLAETVNEPFAFFETIEIEDESELEEFKMFFGGEGKVEKGGSIDDPDEEDDDDVEDNKVEAGGGKEKVEEIKEAEEAEEVEEVEKIEDTEEEEDIREIERKEDRAEEADIEIEREDESNTAFERELTYEEENSYSKKTSTPPPWNSRNSGFNNREYGIPQNDSVSYGEYVEIQEKMKRQKIIIYILAFFLVVTLGYIAYQLLFGSKGIFPKESFPEIAIPGSTIENSRPAASKVLTDSIAPEEQSLPQDTAGDAKPIVSETFNDSIASAKKSSSPDTIVVSKQVVPGTPKDNVVSVKKTPPKDIPSANSKQMTVVGGQRLTTIALNEYGDKIFWVYIYLENKAILPNPNVLPVGIKITIPPAAKYGIDRNDSASIRKARGVAAGL